MITIFMYHRSFKVLQRIHGTMSKNSVIVIINTFIQQGNIELIKNYSKDFCQLLSKILFFSKTFCSKIPEKNYHRLFSILLIINVS